jgi:type IV pilus assembly protein PilQ
MKCMQEKRMMSQLHAHWAALAMVLGLSFGLSTQAQAENTIQSINSTQQAGVEVVRIELSEPLTAIQAPARIAIDLPGVGNAMGKTSVDINQGNLRSVSVAQAGERTRLVLNLKQATTYRAQLQGKALLLILESGNAPTATANAAEPVRFAPSINTTQLPLKEVDFRKGNDGAGRVVVNLANNQVGVDIRQQGQGLVIEFLKTSLPDSLRRRLDVTDFGTPVQFVTTSQVGDRVRMIVDSRGAWEHSAYQSESQFVLEVRPQKIDPNKLVQGPGYSGEKLTLNFQNIEVRALLQVIADFTNFNVVTSDTVTGNVTLRLKDVPWDQALDIILQAKSLGLRKSGNVILIAPKDELAAKEKAELESKSQLSSLEPVRTQSFQLNYTKAEEVAKGLSGQNSSQGASSGANASRMLSPRGSVIFETRTNQLFVSDIPSKLE